MKKTAYQEIPEGATACEKEITDIAFNNVGSENVVCNPNLLINGDFSINQRGLPNYAFTDGITFYFVDRWQGSGLYSVYESQNKTLSCGNANSKGQVRVKQLIDEHTSKYIQGKTVTLSANLSDTFYKATFSVETPLQDIQVRVPLNDNSGEIRFCGATLNGEQIYYVELFLEYGYKTITINYIKLEIGNNATPLVPRPYAEELAICKRYYQIIRCATSNTFMPIGNCYSVASDGKAYATITLECGMRTTPNIFLPTEANQAIQVGFSPNNFVGNVKSYSIYSFDINRRIFVLELELDNFSGSPNTPFDIILTAWSFIQVDFDAEIYLE